MVNWIDSNSVRLTTYPANSTFLSPVNGRTEWPLESKETGRCDV